MKKLLAVTTLALVCSPLWAQDFGFVIQRESVQPTLSRPVFTFDRVAFSEINFLNADSASVGFLFGYSDIEEQVTFGYLAALSWDIGELDWQIRIGGAYLDTYTNVFREIRFGDLWDKAGLVFLFGRQM